MAALQTEDIFSFLKSYSRACDTYLDRFFALKKKEGASIDPEIERAVGIIQDYGLGGKKIRGALTCIGYFMSGGRGFEKILPVSCGVELLHNFLLIHDDIIDKDTLRRGKPTVHVRYEKDKKGMGAAKAIIAGDMAAFWGYGLIVESGFSGEAKSKALAALNALLVKTAYGQMLDIDSDRKKAVGWKDVYKIREYKTAYYTFVMPLVLGAVLAGASKASLGAIENFGVRVGVSFQLSDDILGTFGDTDKTGKSSEGDISEGKRTLLFVKSLELATPSQRRFLLKNYGSVGLNKKKITEVKEVIRKTGSVEFSRKMAQEFVEKGDTYVVRMTPKARYQKLLKELSRYVVSRDR